MWDQPGLRSLLAKHFYICTDAVNIPIYRLNGRRPVTELIQLFEEWNTSDSNKKEHRPSLSEGQRREQ